jgi:hypothetical protein
MHGRAATTLVQLSTDNAIQNNGSNGKEKEDGIVSP